MADNADGEVKIKATIDTKDLDKELNGLKSKVDKAGKDIEKKGAGIKGFGENLKAGAAATAAGAAVAAAAIKKTVEALEACSAAYREQADAEKMLGIAARNNPYLNPENVYNLQNFASDLQKVTEVSDQVSFRVMAQLANTGRNEAEIMQIMRAAADMAAATGQDIGSVAQQLGQTFNGNAAALARQFKEIKNLTAAELEAGKAVEIIAERYKGNAAELANVENQLTNAWGDFKENIGAGWQAVTEPVKKFFLDVLNDINEATEKTRNLKNAKDTRGTDAQTSKSTKDLIDASTAQVEHLQKQINDTIDLLNDEDALQAKIQQSRGYYTRATAQGNLINLQKQYEAEIKTLEELTAEYNKLSEAEKKAADAKAADAKAKRAAELQADRDEKATKIINVNKDALNQQLEQLKLKADLTGQNVDAQAIYNAYLQSYIDLVTKSDGLVTENNEAAKERFKLLLEAAEAAKQQATEEEQLAESTERAEERKRKAEAIAEKARALLVDAEAERLQLIKDINENEVLSEQEKADAIKKINEEIEQDKKDHYTKLAGEIAAYIEKTQSVINDASALMLQNVKTENAVELQELENRYNKGEESETDYYNKRKELRRKAAQDEYKIKMFEWSASLATATANIAEGVSKAIAQGGAAGLVTGLLVGAAGAVQLSSILASKPLPPSFYTGGVIGGFNGASYGPDNTLIQARGGEMVLNAVQQRNLWDMIAGNQNRGGYSLTVNNTQAGRVDTNIKQTNDGLIVEIFDKHINKGLADGSYDGGFAAMNTRQTGVSYL